MRPSTQLFLRTFNLAHRANWPYLLVRRSSAAEQCLVLFQNHGLVRSFGPAPAALGRLSRAGAQRRRERLLVWLQPQPADYSGAGPERSRLQRRGPAGATSRGGRLRLTGQPSRRHSRFLTCADLRRRYGDPSRVAFLETPRGILSSAEALRHKVGGWLLAELLR